MFGFPRLFKEVAIEETQSNKWRELFFKTGGTPSTLQDIKVIPSAGGYCFQELKHRFFYWRTEYDVLKLIEHSLDTNLLNNQLRIRFEESPILDGITVYEKEESVILLLPTVSSVHKLVFPHPFCDKSYDVCALSIFSNINVNNIRDPTSFYFFNATPNIPHCGTSILTADNDALFCLGLNNGTLLLVRLENQTGMGFSSYLKLDSSIPRILSGLTEMFRGNRTDDSHVVVSLTMDERDDDVLVFALSRSGQLRVFSYTKLSCLCNLPLIPTGSVPSVAAERNILRKTKAGRDLFLVAYVSVVESSNLFILKEDTFCNEFQLRIDRSIPAPEEHDLVEMITEYSGEIIWGIWRSKLTGISMVSPLITSTCKSILCLRESNPLFEEDASNQTIPESMGDSTYYLNRIFESGVFSADIITKVLHLIRENDPAEPVLSKFELRSMVYETIETEIAKEVANIQLTEEIYVELVSRHWNRFYSNCLQYKEDEKQGIGLIWLSSSSLLVVIAKSNLSFYRPTDVLEDDFNAPSDTDEKIPENSYWHLIDTIKSLDFTADQKIKFYEMLSNTDDLKHVVPEVVNDVRSKDTIVKIDNLLKYSDLPLAVNKLCDILYMPETFENSEDRSDLFRSNIGVKIVATSAKQIIQFRLDVSFKFAVLLSLIEKKNLKIEFGTDVPNFCKAYTVLNFCCKSIVTDNRDMISVLELVLHKTDSLRQNMLLDTIWSLCEHLWCITNNKPLAEFLSVNKQYLLLEDYARLLNYKCDAWRSTLMQCYLEMNEPYKAFDMIRRDNSATNDIDTDIYLEAIYMFEQYEQSHFVTLLTKLAIHGTKPDSPNLPILYTESFSHNLKLGNFDLAYDSVVRNPDRKRRADNLCDLVITLIDMRKLDQLLEFPYTGLINELERILEKRTRSLDAERADVYYKFMYAFHIRHGCVRKAAIAMFQQGLKSDDNETQKSCYAACLSAFSVIDPKHAWLLKPQTTTTNEDDEEISIDILELSDIYRLYELASARCKLEDCSPRSSPAEVVAGLISIHLYKTALKVAHLCKLNLEPIFEALVTSYANIPNENDPWQWLIPNDVTELAVGDVHPVAVCLRLLEELLKEYEEPNMSILHKAVVKQMLSLNISLPFWIQLSYKKRNASELLKLYLDYGVIEEAVKLACGIIQASLTGKDAANFGIDKPLSIDSPILRIPVNTLDLLLLELRHQKMHDYFKLLKYNVDSYINTAISLTADRMTVKKLGRFR